MKRRRGIVTRQVYNKCKSRLNIHGLQQEYGVNYLETYSPVVNWFSTRTLLNMAAVKKWHPRQVDFIQAHPHAPIQYDLYMELPKGFKTKRRDGSTHVLQLLKNLYGQKQTGRVWNHHLNNVLRR